MPRQPTTDQFDLFFKPQEGDILPIPEWQALPEGTCQAVTTLMVRLILDHVNGESVSPREAARHDS